MDDRPPVEDHTLENGPVDQPQVVVTAQRRDGSPFPVVEQLAGRKRRILQEQGLSSRPQHRPQLVQIQSPLAVDHPVPMPAGGTAPTRCTRLSIPA